MKLKFDKVITGLITGILVPAIAFLVYGRVVFPYLSIREYFYRHWDLGGFSPVLSLMVILNLGIFFIFYKLYMNRAAQGVIMATFVYALIIFAVKLAQ